MAIDWESLSREELLEEIRLGGRFVQYSYCFSIILLSFKRRSKARFIRAGRSAAVGGIPWTLFTLLFGWWGIPWGPIWSIQCITRNMRGGHNVTDEIVDVLL
jgi:hypothetical protein